MSSATALCEVFNPGSSKQRFTLELLKAAPDGSRLTGWQPLWGVSVEYVKHGDAWVYEVTKSIQSDAHVHKMMKSLGSLTLRRGS